jgi:hypothetical protein
VRERGRGKAVGSTKVKRGREGKREVEINNGRVI